jgi:PAS domain S-box-containing protein
VNNTFFEEPIRIRPVDGALNMGKPITKSLPKPSDREIAQLLQQLNDADVRLRELLGDKIDAVLSPAGETFLLRRAQEKLMLSEAMLNAAQRIARFGSWELDLSDMDNIDGNKLRWSDEVFRIFGFEPGQFEPKTDHFFQVVHPDDREAVRTTAHAAIREDKHYEIDHRIILPDGRVRYVHEEAEIFKDPETGRPLKMVGTVQDITERKERDEELRLSEERFSSAFAHAPIGMALVLPDGRWLKVNRALCRIVGYTEEELYGKTFQDITHPDDLSADLAQVRRILDDEIHYYEMEKRYIHKEGRLVWAQLSVSLVRDREKKPLYFVSQIQDISERKMADNKLAEQAALIDQARDAIIQRDLSNTILFWNKGAERVYGWTAQEALGRKTSELLYRDLASFSEAAKAVVSRGEWSGELESVTKAGQPVVMECRWTLLRDEAGQPKSVLCINTDITERKRIEAHFLRAQRMESIGTLAGGIAHDLNNLLAPILMGVDLLRHLGLAAGPAAEVVNGIERSAKRGSNLVRQVLSFARGVEGTRVAFNLRDVIADVESIVVNTFPKNITLDVKVADDLWLISGDPTQLHQVLLNLFLNARDAMPDGGRLGLTVQNVVIDSNNVAGRAEVSAGRYIFIEVTDAGCGIPRDNIEKIFDPFFTTKELGKGTGLGLATALGIVRSHGGFINAHSEPGKGSTFKLYLPAQVELAQIQGDGPEDTEWPRGHGEGVLLVDDETSILTITRQTLEAFGYKVWTAQHGAQAVAIYALHRDVIAVVVTDMMMPIMDGTATIAALRQMKPSVKIIAASGLNSHGGLHKAGQAGVKHFLSKPYTTGAMLTTIKTVLTEEV